MHPLAAHLNTKYKRVTETSQLLVGTIPWGEKILRWIGTREICLALRMTPMTSAHHEIKVSCSRYREVLSWESPAAARYRAARENPGVCAWRLVQWESNWVPGWCVTSPRARSSPSSSWWQLVITSPLQTTRTCPMPSCISLWFLELGNALQWELAPAPCPTTLLFWLSLKLYGPAVCVVLSAELPFGVWCSHS